MPEIPEEIEEVRIVRVQEGDVIIARLKEPTSQEFQELLYHDLVSVWPWNKVLVIGPELEIEVSRTDPESASSG